MASNSDKHVGFPHTVEEMTIAGCTTRRGIRHWEDQGLLGNVYRTPGDTRRYSALQLDYARIIAAASFAGWSLDQIKDMLAEYYVDATVYEALMVRLEQQIMAATRLAERLPKPPEKMQQPVLEYDL